MSQGTIANLIEQQYIDEATANLTAAEQVCPARKRMPLFGGDTSNRAELEQSVGIAAEIRTSPCGNLKATSTWCPCQNGPPVSPNSLVPDKYALLVVKGRALDDSKAPPELHSLSSGKNTGEEHSLKCEEYLMTVGREWHQPNEDLPQQPSAPTPPPPAAEEEPNEDLPPLPSAPTPPPPDAEEDHHQPNEDILLPSSPTPPPPPAEEEALEEQGQQQFSRWLSDAHLPGSNQEEEELGAQGEEEEQEEVSSDSSFSFSWENPNDPGKFDKLRKEIHLQLGDVISYHHYHDGWTQASIIQIHDPSHSGGKLLLSSFYSLKDEDKIQVVARRNNAGAMEPYSHPQYERYGHLRIKDHIIEREDKVGNSQVGGELAKAFVPPRDEPTRVEIQC